MIVIDPRPGSTSDPATPGYSPPEPLRPLGRQRQIGQQIEPEQRRRSAFSTSAQRAGGQDVGGAGSTAASFVGSSLDGRSGWMQ